MRELKFRVYDKTGGYYIAILDNDCFGIKQVARIIQELEALKHEYVIEQDTGLKDRNGKEICEGGIVQCGDYKGKVHYSVGVACYCVGDYTPIYQISRIENESFITLKVIGNINENPELLEHKG